jgi:hypothetical protein
VAGSIKRNLRTNRDDGNIPGFYVVILLHGVTSSNPAEGMVVCPVCFLCVVQVEALAMGRSLIQRTPTGYRLLGISVCLSVRDLETLTRQLGPELYCYILSDKAVGRHCLTPSQKMVTTILHTQFQWKPLIVLMVFILRLEKDSEYVQNMLHGILTD